MLSRTQVIVLAFVAAAWAAVVAILAAAPDVYDQALGLPIVDRRQFEVVFLLVAFLAGVIRLPASALELAGAIPHQGPAWYVVLQGVIGAVQFVIGIAMLVGYRRNGLWGNP
ncbi:MAG: hypothetical protein E6J30_03220 [Chloroflexi bacterium]|nr:MAG: hypothetical protein E6J30_03220 [Chloroflexota bacterium]